MSFPTTKTDRHDGCDSSVCMCVGVRVHVCVCASASVYVNECECMCVCVCAPECASALATVIVQPVTFPNHCSEVEKQGHDVIFYAVLVTF